MTLVILAGSMPPAFMLSMQLAGGRLHLAAGAGIEQHDVAAGVDDQRRERDRDELVRQAAAFIAAFTSSTLAFLMNAGSCGFSQMPS